ASATIGRIHYTVWSDVFTCPHCAGDIVFWVAAANKSTGKVSDTFCCSHCSAELTKRNVEKKLTQLRDDAIDQDIKQIKQVPVLISYSVGRQRFEKRPDAFDLALIAHINEMKIPYWF